MQNLLESSSREQASHTNQQSYPKWYWCHKRSAGKGHACRGGTLRGLRNGIRLALSAVAPGSVGAKSAED